MKTAHRISALANQLNELQACLGRASGGLARALWKPSALRPSWLLHSKSGTLKRYTSLNRSVTSIAYRIPITLPTDAAHRLIKSSLRWAFLSAKRIKPDSQPRPLVKKNAIKIILLRNNLVKIDGQFTDINH
jgi:hypothetical protein